VGPSTTGDPEGIVSRTHPAATDDTALPAYMRDIVALSAMPAVWIGHSPMAIAESVRDLMVSMLSPESVYVELQDRAHGRTHVATAHGRAIAAPHDSGAALYRDTSSTPLLLDREVALGLMSLPIGSDGDLGHIALGSSRPVFPTKGELLLMRVMANQIAVALKHTELLAKHEAAEQELDAARSAAERSSRLKSEFLGMMSHELRTPLNAIGGYVQLLADGMRGPITQEQRTDLERIRRSQQHLIRVIDNVLGYLKLGSGRVSYEIRDVRVEDMVVAAEDIVRSLMESKQLRYERKSERDVFVRADRDKVQQIILNLLSNAIKFTDGGGSVAIEWAPVEANVAIRVKDTGHGIPADRVENVFEPFVQVDSSRTRPAEGTGLGLSISRDFAIGMGGKLFVESELERGSVFTLVLPQSPRVR
jgi:signal transduction histidine kinase